MTARAIVRFAVDGATGPLPRVVLVLGNAAIATTLATRLPAARVEGVDRAALRRAPPGSADLVLASCDEEGDERAVLPAARARLSRRGRLVLAVPVKALARWLRATSGSGLAPKRLALSVASSSGRLALLEVRPGRPGGLVVEPPCPDPHEGG